MLMHCAGIALFCVLAFDMLAQVGGPSQKASPPPTRRDSTQEVLHGVTIADPYRWLEDQNSPDTRAWINAQNAYTHALLDEWPGRTGLEKRLTELEKVESIRPPVERSGRLFYLKRAANEEQYVIYMRQGIEGNDRVLIDPNPMSSDHSTNVEILDVSNDGKLMAYVIRQGGKDESEVHIMDVDSGRSLPDVLPSAVYFDLSFLPNASGFYYATMTDDGPRVRFHKMGSSATSDVEVFGKGYQKEAIIVGDPTLDGRHLVIQVLHGSSADKTEIWLQDLVNKGPIVPVIKDIDARFFAFPGGDQLFLQTNWKAPRGRILALDIAHPALDKSREVVPEGEAAIDSVALADGKLVVSYVKNASSQVKVFAADGKPAGEMVFRRWVVPAIFSRAGTCIMFFCVLIHSLFLLRFIATMQSPTNNRYGRGRRSRWTATNSW